MYFFFIFINFRPECTESCKVRQRELENEAKSLRKELRIKDDQYIAAQKEINVNLKKMIIIKIILVLNIDYFIAVGASTIQTKSR